MVTKNCPVFRPVFGKKKTIARRAACDDDCFQPPPARAENISEIDGNNLPKFAGSSALKKCRRTFAIGPPSPTNNAAFIFSLSLPPPLSLSLSLSLLPWKAIHFDRSHIAMQQKKPKFLDSDAERQMRDEFHSPLSLEEDENTGNR